MIFDGSVFSSARDHLAHSTTRVISPRDVSAARVWSSRLAHLPPQTRLAHKPNIPRTSLFNMARTTRSTTTHEKEKPAESTQTPRKGAGKKRKRTSTADGADQPVTKQPRTDEDVKDDSTPDPEEQQATGTPQPELPSSGDVPILPEDAEKVLEILEM